MGIFVSKMLSVCSEKFFEVHYISVGFFRAPELRYPRSNRVNNKYQFSSHSFASHECDANQIDIEANQPDPAGTDFGP